MEHRELYDPNGVHVTEPGGNKSVLIQVIHDGMGVGDLALQHALLRKYLLLLQENNTLPGAICFYTSGVRMVVEGSPVLDVLQSLEARGVRLIVCKTCLDHYGLLEKVRVGIVGGMGDIIAAQRLADKVISL
jgi:intracellular sulfur oxidation DsrE/DsrF family protein